VAYPVLKEEKENNMSINSDTQSINALVTALYEAISRPAGELPDWERMQALFMEGARLIPPSAHGGPPPVLTFEQFVERVNEAVRRAGEDDRGFCERQLASRSESFANIAHVWSTYESRHSAKDPEPFARGINSFQLAFHGGRWWVVTIFWDAEQPEKPIPVKYLH
jgi:hypothetical protein